MDDHTFSETLSDFWGAWRSLYPHTPIMATPKEFIALGELIRSGVTLPQFIAVAQLIKRSPKMAGRRNLYMLRHVWADAMDWLEAHPDTAFQEAVTAVEDDPVARVRAKVQELSRDAS